MTDGTIWWIRNFVEQALFTVDAFTMFTGWTIRHSSKISGNFFLPPIKNPITIYLGHTHVKWILNLPLKSLAKQVYMQCKLGDSTVSYIVNAVKVTDAVKCKMLLMWQMVIWWIRNYILLQFHRILYSPDGTICHINNIL